MNEKLEEIICFIKDSDDYKECILLREKMKKNEELMQLIDDLKTFQKKHVNNGYQYQEELDKIEKQLNDIPIYSSYIEHLEKVNQMILYVEDELNDYFIQLFN